MADIRRIALGTVAVLEVQSEHADQANVRMQSEVVGVSPDECVILRPTDDTARNLAPGQSVLVRCLDEGVVVGFRSTIHTVVADPGPLLLLNYPEDLEELSLRKSRRVDCFLRGKIIDGKLRINGVIQNVSRGGCRFLVPTPRDVSESDLKRDTVLTMDLDCPGTERPLRINGAVRNTAMTPEGLAVGFQFTDATEDAKSLFTYLTLS